MISAQHNFTQKYTGVVTALITRCAVSASWDPLADRPEPVAERYLCLWDTGANISAISERVASDLGLSTEGLVPVMHAGGISDAIPQHVVNLHLPNNAHMIGQVVVQLPFTNFDVILGMDIISQGDFAITNFNGKTTFSFRIPSVEEIDFVAEYDAARHGD